MKTIFKFLIAILLFSIATVHADSIKKIHFGTIDRMIEIIDIEFETIDEGIFSNYNEGIFSNYKKNKREYIIEIYYQHDWETFWYKHTRGIFPPPELPEINFQKYFIVIAIDETRKTSGYFLDIENIFVAPAIENQIVQITLQLRQPGPVVQRVSTRPYHIVKILRPW